MKIFREPVHNPKSATMQFHQYQIFWPDEIRKNLIEASGNPHLPRNMDEAQLNHIRSEDAWVLDRKPFYRFWPGLFYAFSKVNLSDIRIRALQFILPDDLHTIVVEFPKDIPFEAYEVRKKSIEDVESIDTLSLNSILIYQSELHVTPKGIGQLQSKPTRQNVYFCALYGEDAEGPRCHRFRISFNDNEMDMTVLEYLESRKNITENQQRYLGCACRILVMLALLADDDPKLFERIVLDRDQEKFDLKEAEKFWKRAKNNGMYGWDVGKNIPTREEVERFKATGTFRGKSIPHLRNLFFATRWAAKGRLIAKNILISETLDYRHPATIIPEGFYGNENESVENQPAI